jgi:hypothetical protein
MNLDGITLPDSLEWEDEFDWSPITQSVGYGATGALFIQEGVKAKGRTITLVGTDEVGWVTRSVVTSLQTKRDTASWSGTLTLPDARTFTVMFRNSDNALEVSPVVPYNQYASGQMFKIKSIKLMEVS